MKTKGWFSENITGILAIITTLFVMAIDTIMLTRETKTNDTTAATILSSVHGAWMVVLGFYFVSSKNNKEKDKQIADLMENKKADS